MRQKDPGDRGEGDKERERERESEELRRTRLEGGVDDSTTVSFIFVVVVVVFQPEMKSQNPEPRYVPRERVPRRCLGLFLQTITRSTIVNWNVIRAARPWISRRYRVPPLSAIDSSVLTSVVLPVSALRFVELFRWPIARIFSITILLSFL